MDSYHGYRADPLPEDLTGRFLRPFSPSPQAEIEVFCYRGSAILELEHTPFNNCFALCLAQYSAMDAAWDDGEVRSLSPGSFVLLRPRPRLAFACHEDAGEIVLVFFRKRLLYQTLLPFLGRSSSLLDFFIRCMEKSSADRLLHMVPPGNSRLHHALYALLIASFELAPDMEALKESCLATLLIFFSRYYRQQGLNRERKVDVEMILRYLSENCATASLESCAAYFSYNPSYLSRLIREQSGRNFSQLLRDFKLEHACMLLRETELPVSQIAALTGYNHMGNFYKQFKGKYGLLPRELRSRFLDMGQKKMEE